MAGEFADGPARAQSVKQMRQLPVADTARHEQLLLLPVTGGVYEDKVPDGYFVGSQFEFGPK